MTPSARACLLAALLLTPFAPAAQAPRGVPPPIPGLDIGPLETRANPVTPDNPVPRRLKTVMPPYPTEASGSALVVTFTIKATLGQEGGVAESRIAGYQIDSPPGDAGIWSLVQFRPAFEKASLDAVRQWRYNLPANPPISFYVQLRFAPGAESSVVWHDAAEPDTAGTAARNPPSPLESRAIRVGGAIPAPKKIKDVKMVYPSLAAAAGVSGIVIVETVLDTNGRVAEARIMRSIPMLDQAALEAVRQWEFTPTLLNGVPTPVIMSQTINFKLGQ